MKISIILILLAATALSFGQEGAFGTKAAPVSTLSFSGPDTVNTRWIWFDQFPHEGIIQIFAAGADQAGVQGQLNIEHRFLMNILAGDTLVSEWFTTTTADSTLHKSNTIGSKTITGETYDLSDNSEYGASRAIQFRNGITTADTLTLIFEVIAR